LGGLKYSANQPCCGSYGCTNGGSGASGSSDCSSYHTCGASSSSSDSGIPGNSCGAIVWHIVLCQLLTFFNVAIRLILAYLFEMVVRVQDWARPGASAYKHEQAYHGYRQEMG
jgi:hypothetical protein